jgi:phosphatidate cytidylyltransferase
MLRQRVLTALLLAPLVVALIVLAPTAVLAGVAAVVFLAALWEWSALSGLRGTPARATFLLLAAVGFALLWLLHARASSIWAVAVGLAWWAVTAQWLRHFAYAAAPTGENRALKLAAGLLAILPAWSALLMLHAHQPYGQWWTLLALFIVWAADIGAYFSGRRYGKRKLAPQISPGKTWAGVYGAVLAGALVMLLGAWLLQVRGAGLAAMLVLAILTIGVSILGDLLESLLKRHAGVKDSGTLFPGHGGLLDRLDSVFAALPVLAAGLWLLTLLQAVP